MTDRETRHDRKRRREELIAQRQRQDQSRAPEQARPDESFNRAGQQKQTTQPNKPRLPD